MKKKDVVEGLITKVNFPNKGVMDIDGEKVVVKNVIPGQTIKARITKKRRNKIEGRLLEVVEKSSLEEDTPCPVFGQCGGCLYQSLPYEEQLKLKASQVIELLNTLNVPYEYEGITPSPHVYHYRNKMEYSFGDAFKNGPLALGMHKRGAFHDIVTVDACKIVDEDFNTTLKTTLAYFGDKDIPYYAKRSHEGYLRHLVVRKGTKTKEILINLVTSSQMSIDLTAWVEKVSTVPLKGEIVSIMHTINDSVADVVKADEIRKLYGKDYFTEELLGLKFHVSAFSFFQTNSLGAEKLYSVVRDYVGETKDKIIFDLYSGTGTITQILAPVAKKAVGVEIVEEAVEAAKQNAKLNGLDNCEFIAGDVLKVIDSLQDKPDIIVLDPPRDGIHPKALQKIIDFGVEQIVYVSCKPTSLVRDLEVLLARGYQLDKVRCVDMFPHTVHVETIAKITLK
ncbi:23S rRNA (uracil(1939)-C(5))-methyltransferase RlmD [Vallitalea pronyensis]|uniref:23S rRNA (Uracil(1939)-C(5))-methyltransferase RlmD n=1 Tax=Vallitalea pronyensis TaxID=1348613 RepID=A0A8J8MIS6_9FIRM|nr:23S rRNA (uracil(1939)-C(5))-methyltransferase RlmD [Vallitalea pronyensis]QUI22053.1 23S rRNA (uracil(1939)-C(5))-methyltransferase RlmD [Vallitalea pronyensis]